MARRILQHHHFAFSDHGGTTPLKRAYATNWPICSLAWTRMRRYMPSTVASRPMTVTLRERSSGLDPGVCDLHGVKRSLEVSDDLCFIGDRLLDIRRGEVVGHLRPGKAQQIEVGGYDMHEDFAGGAHTGRGSPSIFLSGDGLGEGDKLVGDMEPFAVITLPKALQWIRLLSVQGGGSQQESK